MKYKITGLSVTSSDQSVNQILQNSFPNMWGSENSPTGSINWFKWEIKQVTGTKVIIGTNLSLLDGTVKDTGNSVFDISNYQSFPMVIPIDMKIGDQIPSSLSNPFKVVEIKNIEIGNKHIDVFELISTNDEFTNEGSIHTNYDFYYDKNTGMLITMIFDGSGIAQGISLKINGVINAIDFSDDLLKSNSNDFLNNFISFLKNIFDFQK
jgi:hypothetical protein